ncbi:TonB-dependent receptor domain-containing protein [Ideonella paludis]|uniref:TonB-dependent receptor n=1 Tax=Ideonella paludis TaxID=1233411 RepID=A0ABS5DYH6_9BURK|nr:TonB-dependent receptor [Ideonella paludis]MBQ0936200.1 TonB-dependent receptor [Ideonella paludis]
MKTFATLTPVSLAILMGFAATGAHAQTAAADDKAEAKADTLQLERVVVTGTSTARSKMKQSVSVSTLDAEQLQNAVASSAADVLRNVPGVRAEASGGEGNANLGVRGLPMSDGGGRYVQLQEDGLPVILFGDISFATADQFVRADYMTDTVEAIRGGSSATMTTNGTGAIVNFRSKTGKTNGGAVGLGLGLDHRQQRLDFAYGTKVADGLNLQFGGFYRIGEGTRNTDATVENGGQFRAALTKDLGQGSYLRLNLKSLNDRTPTYLPVPVTTSGSKINTIQGIDPRTAFFVNSRFANDTVVDKNGNTVNTNPQDGLAVQVNSIGIEGQFNLGNGLSFSNRFRKSDITGRFIGVFPAGGAATDAANGANQYTGTTPVFSAHIFNTSLDDMGNVFNDARLQKEFKLDGNAKLTATGGLFSGIQNIGQTWYWNRYNIGLTGDGAALYDNTGKVTTQPVGDATTTWGGCCFRNLDVRVTAMAPYAAVTYDNGPLSVDGSIRFDKQRGTGTQKFGDAASGNTWNPAKTNTIGWSTSGTSYSLGGNYELNKGMATFARFSHGVTWKSPDRVVWDADVDSGRAPYPVSKIDQFEAGVKYRTQGYSAFVTAFLAKTKEGAGFELTTQTVKENAYKSQGIEAELAASFGDLRLTGGFTLTNAEITSGANTGKTPRRQANLVYQVSPSYVFGPVEVGGSLIGTTKSYAQDDNVVVLPGYATVNLFANYEVARNLTASLGVNNLFNTLGYTEAEGQGNLTNNPLYIARAINGRSARVSLKYSF